MPKSTELWKKVACGIIVRISVWPCDLVIQGGGGCEMSQRGWAGFSHGRRFGMGSLWRVLSRRKTGWRDVDRWEMLVRNDNFALLWRLKSAVAGSHLSHLTRSPWQQTDCCITGQGTLSDSFQPYQTARAQKKSLHYGVFQSCGNNVIFR